MGWLSDIFFGPSETPPPPSKRELQDIKNAHKSDGMFKGWSDKQVKEWAKNRHGDKVEGTVPNAWGGRSVVTRGSHPSERLTHNYDSQGNYVSTTGGGWFG